MSDDYYSQIEDADHGPSVRGSVSALLTLRKPTFRPWPGHSGESKCANQAINPTPQPALFWTVSPVEISK